MRYKKLWATMLIVHFAKGTLKPLSSAIIRLVIGFMGASSLGYFISKSVEHLELPTDFPDSFLICVCIGLGFICSGFILLVMGMSQSTSAKGQVFQGITKLMPLPSATRWLLVVSPVLLVLTIFGLFGGIVIHQLANLLQTSGFFVEVGWIIGLLSGYGCMIARWPRNLLAKSIIFMILVSCAFLAFDRIFTTESERVRSLLLILIYTICTVPVYGFIESFFRGVPLQVTRMQSEEKSLIPEVLPPGLWFFVKLWRNRRTRSAFLIALAFSVSAAAGLIIRDTPIQNPSQLLIFGAVLAATFACDVRGVMRRYIPPEIVLLKGVRAIVSVEVLSVLFLGLALGSPMFMALHGQTNDQAQFLIFYVVIQLFSSLSGLLASTLLVPGPGDTGSQFFSATFACAIILLAPKVGHFSGIDYSHQFPYWLIASLLVAGGIYSIEIIRRRNYGRS